MVDFEYRHNSRHILSLLSNLPIRLLMPRKNDNKVHKGNEMVI